MQDRLKTTKSEEYDLVKSQVIDLPDYEPKWGRIMVNVNPEGPTEDDFKYKLRSLLIEQ